MPEYTTRDYLKKGQYVYFLGKGWEDPFKNRVYKIGFSQRFYHRVGYVVKYLSYYNINLADDLRLYPDSEMTLYEIGVALKGNVALYVQLPLGQYYFYLEKVGAPSSPLVAGYMGAFLEEDLPNEHPLRLREYITKNEQTIVYSLYNDTSVDQKAVLTFFVNRLKLEEVPEDEQKEILENIEDYKAKGLLVELPHWSLSVWAQR